MKKNEFAFQDTVLIPSNYYRWHLETSIECVSLATRESGMIILRTCVVVSK